MATRRQLQASSKLSSNILGRLIESIRRPDRKWRRRQRNHNRRGVRLESLEDRKLFAADTFAVVRDNTWMITTTHDPVPEVDLYFGRSGDKYVSGNWTGDGIVENPGVVRLGDDGLYHWYLDTDGDPMPEIDLAFGLPGDTPVTGDWDGDGTTNIGVVRSGYSDGLLRWFLDTDGDAMPEIEFAYGLTGDVPVVGDWDGDGRDNLGVARAQSDGLLHWYLDLDLGTSQGDALNDIPGYGFGFASDKPIVGDWDGDGDDDAGVTRNGSDGYMRWLLDNDRDSAAEFDGIYGLVGDTPVAGVFLFPEIAVAGVVSGESVRLPDADFGKTSATHTFTVYNQGSAWMSVGAVQIPAGFTLVKGLNSAIPPESSDTIVVRVDTATPGERTGTLLIPNGDGNESPFAIQLAANVRAADVRIDGIANGGTHIVNTIRNGGSSDVAITVRNHGTSAAQIGNIVASGAFTLRSPSSGTLAPGATATIVVNYQTHTAGQYLGELTFSTNDPQESTFRVRLEGQVVEPFAQATVSYSVDGVVWSGISDNQKTPIDFGLVSVGDRSTILFRVQNFGNIPLELGQPSELAGFRHEDGLVSSLLPQHSDTFTVAIDTSSAGAKLGSITFTTNDANVGVFSFPVKGTVGVPDIQLSTTSLNFGTLQRKSTRSAHELRVTNVGTGPLRFTVDQLPTGYVLAGGASAFVLAPGKSIPLKLTLTTSNPGYRNGELVLRTNDGDELIQRVQLNGVVAPFFSVQSKPSVLTGVHKLVIKNLTDAPQTFRLDHKADSVQFKGEIPSMTLGAGETVTYQYTLNKPEDGELLRFWTSDPVTPWFKVSYDKLGSPVTFAGWTVA
jgi:archaellum component FlaF (FlaF/FlaG flagellin family)